MGKINKSCEKTHEKIIFVNQCGYKGFTMLWKTLRNLGKNKKNKKDFFSKKNK